MKPLLLFLLLAPGFASKTVHALPKADTAVSVLRLSPQGGNFEAENAPVLTGQNRQVGEPKERPSLKSVLAVALVLVSLAFFVCTFSIYFAWGGYNWLLAGGYLGAMFTAYFLAKGVLKRPSNARSRKWARVAKWVSVISLYLTACFFVLAAMLFAVAFAFWI